MEQQHACPGGDRDRDLLGQHEAATGLELLLGQEDLNVALEFSTVFSRESPVERHVPADDLPRGGRQW